MPKCPNCGVQNSPQNQFCDDCGAELTRRQAKVRPRRRQTGQQMVICPICHTASPLGSRICVRCKSPFPLSSGVVLNSRYRIEQFLSRGGMGAIYKAIDTKMRNTPVALKECSPQDQKPANLPKYIQMFKREAQILEQLNLLRVVPRFIEYFEADGKPYFAMEFVNGTNLLQLMEAKKKPFPVAQVVDWGVQICEVLSFLHNQKPPIVYRDLKPENLMLTQDGTRLVLVDFGIAREIDPKLSRLTAGIGTQAYMPEEMTTGKTEPRSDLFALAATMFHLLTNQWPESTITPRLRSVNSKMPEWLDEIIAINLSRFPADRYRSADELKKDLEAKKVTKTISCPRCRTTNQARIPYCTNCGTPLSDDSHPCPNCRQPVALNAKYCIHCGNKLM
ncbi:TPA: zinc-ribbon domain-containing protein [Candidatus Poribacteria bacterium]|nr:zinc-ribbon domain-containing protein [Candidatus Poribacteria bacterium]